MWLVFANPLIIQLDFNNISINVNIALWIETLLIEEEAEKTIIKSGKRYSQLIIFIFIFILLTFLHENL